MKYLLLTARYGFCIFPNEAPLKGVLIKSCALPYSCSLQTQMAYQSFCIIIKCPCIFVFMIHSWMCFLYQCDSLVPYMQKKHQGKEKKARYIGNIYTRAQFGTKKSTS